MSDLMEKNGIIFLGQCGICLKNEKYEILIDPVLTDLYEDGVYIMNYPPVLSPRDVSPDLVLCTHEHIDHLNKETVMGIAANTDKTLFVIPKGLSDLLKGWGISSDRIIAMSDDEVITLFSKDIVLKAFSTAHPVHSLDERGYDKNLGYGLVLDGRQYVHLGDTYRTDRLFESLKKLGRIDVLFSPINGRDEEREARGVIGNLSSKESVELAIDLKVGLLIPTHYDMVKGNTEDLENFEREVRYHNRQIDYKILELYGNNQVASEG